MRIENWPVTRGVAARLLVCLLAVAGLMAAGCGKSEPWNVLLVTLDTTRADHIGCYGNDQVSTPHLDGLAAEGVRFAKAYSAIPLTTPSHATILTGKYPLAHGVRDNGQFVLPENQETLAEVLRRHGYATAAAIGAFPLTRRFGTAQGFELYDDRVARTGGGLLGDRVLPKLDLFFDERQAARVNEALFPWLEDHHGEPFFAWAHYFDPHQPHEPPAPYDQVYARDPYLGEIAYADECVGHLLQRLRELGVYERTLVVVASDHGEGRGEHNELTHSLQIYDTTLHVPLIIRVPGGPVGHVVDTPVATVDVLPTVLDLLGFSVAEEVQGRSLRSVFEDPDEALNPVSLYAETLVPRLGYKWGELRALIKGDLKYIHGPRPELFDVAADPGELENLLTSRAETSSIMKAELQGFMDRHAAEDLNAAVPVDDDTRRQLVALGYLSGDGEDASTIEEVLVSGGVAPQDRVGDISAFSQAKNLLQRQRPLLAKEVVQGLVDKDPQNPAYLELLATAYTQLGQLDQAMATLESMAAGGTIGDKLLLQIGWLYYIQGDHGMAEATLQQSLSLENSAQGHYLLANVFAADGDREREGQALEAALEADPGFAMARIDVAIRLAQRGERPAAESHFLRALRDEPYLAKGFFNYGAFLAEDGQLEEAKRQLNRALELKPDYVRVYEAMIQIHLAQGEIMEAQKVFQTLSSRAPDSPEAGRARRLVESVQ